MNYLNAFWVGGLNRNQSRKITLPLGIHLPSGSVFKPILSLSITQITVITMAHTTAAARDGVSALLTAPSACCRSSLNSHAGWK